MVNPTTALPQEYNSPFRERTRLDLLHSKELNCPLLCVMSVTNLEINNNILSSILHMICKI